MQMHFQLSLLFGGEKQQPEIHLRLQAINYDHSGGDNGNDKDHNKRPIKGTFSQKLRKY